jgi:hypothetical protein
MDNKEQKSEIFHSESRPKIETISVKFSISRRLYSRVLSFAKKSGLKESAFFSIALDEYLTKNNF